MENNSDHEIPIGVTLFDAYADDYSAKFSETPFLGSDKQKLWGIPLMQEKNSEVSLAMK